MYSLERTAKFIQTYSFRSLQLFTGKSDLPEQNVQNNNAQYIRREILEINFVPQSFGSLEL